MSNSILGSNPANQVAFNPQLAKQFQQFQQTFNGNPREQIDQMLRSGKITQNQLNQAVEAAKQLNGAFRLV